MNELKKKDIDQRVRDAWRALTGKPKNSISFGLEIKRCSECDRGVCDACGYKVHSEGVSNLHDCNDCGKKSRCEYEPRMGEYVRINCPLWEKED